MKTAVEWKKTAIEWLKILLTPRKEIQYFRMKMRIKHILLMLEEEQKKTQSVTDETL